MSEGIQKHGRFAEAGGNGDELRLAQAAFIAYCRRIAEEINEGGGHDRNSFSRFDEGLAAGQGNSMNICYEQVK